MRVFERIGRMVRADAHGMMDQLEERSLVLKQHLREAELEVAQKRASLEALDDERRRVKEEGQRLEAQVSALDEDVELAMAGDDPELARFAVKRWLPQREALTELCARAARLDERRARLFERLEVQEVQLADLRPRVRAALARPDADACDLACPEVVTEEEVDLELLRRAGAGGVDSTVGEGAR
jgi:phage shock protein A